MKFISTSDILLISSFLLPSTLALLEETLPNGQVIHTSAHESLPSDPDTTLNSRKLDIYLTKPKPGSSSTDDDSSSDFEDNTKVGYNEICGVERPTEETWKANKGDIVDWFFKQFEDYKDWHKDNGNSSPNITNNNNIAYFLKERWAPKALPSYFEFCDKIGSCNVGSCLHLVEKNETNQHDRQMALHVFEWLASADGLYKSVADNLDETLRAFRGGSDNFVDEFSTKPRIEFEVEKGLRKKALAAQVGSALRLTATGVGGVVSDAAKARSRDSEPTGAGKATAAAGLIVDLYLAITSATKPIPGDFETGHVPNIKSYYQHDWEKLRTKMTDAIALNHRDLMKGAANEQGHHILAIMRDSDSFGADDALYQQIVDYVGRVTTGAAINKLWDLQRAYFVLADSETGCENQKRSEEPRGPTEYLVCLPEEPTLEFWLYSIDGRHEGKDKQITHVRGPTGWYKLADNQNSGQYANFTLEDVARSSYWVHKKQLIRKKGDPIKYDHLTAEKILNDESRTEHSQTNGIFTVPICENPGGESISSVFDPKGENYPCMCGSIGWNNKDSYNIATDQTPTFLAQTGLMFSSDWETYCDNRNACDEASDVPLYGMLQALSNPDTDPRDAEIPKKLQHTFKQCRKRKDSAKHRGWPDKDKTNDT
ncbi:hypothetical protein E8E13_005313 [Curvularia kusanoi]|uniref:Uncharacterized protein n=1 Tax=Curvularia kusanoi TaxID=90978 RepID=A0A9P4T8Y9_CURKU|nr:hypothetical protein E8E13_005313 [Curvularia kusanoi]